MECVCNSCGKQWTSRTEELPKYCPECSSRRVEAAVSNAVTIDAVIEPAVKPIAVTQNAVIRPRVMKPIKKATEMSREEYREQMVGFHKQLAFAKSIHFDARQVPPEMECYHGNLLRECPSLNCEIDSGRMAAKNA